MQALADVELTAHEAKRNDAEDDEPVVNDDDIEDAVEDVQKEQEEAIDEGLPPTQEPTTQDSEGAEQ